MFCPNCGIEIKNPEAFCPNCGTRLPQDISVTNDVQEKQEKSATRKMPQEKVQLKAHREQCTEEVNEKVPQNLPKTVQKKYKKSGAGKVIIPIAVVAVAVGGYFFVYQNKNVIDLNRFYTLTLSGYDGNGSAELTFDSEKFEQEYKDKLTLNEASARKWAEEQQQDADYADMIVETFQDYDPIETMCDALENNFYTISQSEELKNGQTVTFECNSQELEDALEAAFGYEFKDLKDYKVEGLKEVTEYDPFENLKVTFKGVNGEGTAEVEKPDDKISDHLKFYVYDDRDLSNGDVVVVWLANVVEDLQEKDDIIVTRTHEEVEVSGLAEPTPTPIPSPSPTPTAAPVASPTPMPTATPAPAEAATQADISGTAVNVESGPALRSDFYKDGQITGTDPEYIIPDSLNRELTYSDIANLSARGLSFARNEMMARMGRGFKNQELADYFKSTSWYQETVSPEVFDAQGLSSIVEANASLMMDEELRLNGGELAIK